MSFSGCRLGPACAPALARLVRGGGGGATLQALRICGDPPSQPQLLDGPAATVLGDALRTSSALTRLNLTFLNLWGDLAARRRSCAR